MTHRVPCHSSHPEPCPRTRPRDDARPGNPAERSPSPCESHGHVQGFLTAQKHDNHAGRDGLFNQGSELPCICSPPRRHSTTDARWIVAESDYVLLNENIGTRRAWRQGDGRLGEGLNEACFRFRPESGQKPKGSVSGTSTKPGRQRQELSLQCRTHSANSSRQASGDALPHPQKDRPISLSRRHFPAITWGKQTEHFLY